jgi:hypothetical protein
MPGLSFKTHPNINKDLFNSQQILGAKDPNRPFPSGQNETPLVKWRIQGMDESSLPLSGGTVFVFFFLTIYQFGFWTMGNMLFLMQSIAGRQYLEMKPM